MSEIKKRDIKELLQLKKLETPGKEYFDHFLTEFQRYQRTELLTEATHSRGILDRVGEWLFPIPRPALAWSTALALLAILAVAVPMNLGTHEHETSFIPTVVKMDKVVNDPLPMDHVNFTDSTPNAYYTDVMRQQPELQKAVAYSEGDLSYPRYVTGESSAPRETSLAF